MGLPTAAPVVYLLEISVGSYEHQTSVHYAYSTKERAEEVGSRLVSRIKSYTQERREVFASSGRDERQRELVALKGRYDDLSDFTGGMFLENPSYDVTELEVRD